MKLLAANPWQPVDPTEFVWDIAAAAHLRRRTSFGASWSQLQQDVKRGFEPTLKEILDGGEQGPDGRHRDEYDEIAAALERSAEQRTRVEPLERAWFYRMIFSPHPLAERMALMWHDHYPISSTKVNARAVLDFSQRLRQHWDRPISKLHHAVLHSAAMLQWLDGNNNSKKQPNENLAREFFELFALGDGAYSENDIRETARALSGLSVTSEASTQQVLVKLDPNRHDTGQKTIFASTGNWAPPDIVRLTCQRTEAATHVARRIFQTFVSDQPTSDLQNSDSPGGLDEMLRPLADRMRTAGDVDVRAGVEMILRSQAFFDGQYRAQRVKSPVELIVGAYRGCSKFQPAPDLNRISQDARLMGQWLFHTPSVAGWPSGLSWLTGSWAVARANFAATFAKTNSPNELDTDELVRTLWATDDGADAVRQRMQAAFPGKAPGVNERVSWMLAQPEAQLL